MWGGSLQSNTAKEAIRNTVLWTQLAVNVISITREACEARARACVCVCVCVCVRRVCVWVIASFTSRLSPTKS